MLRVRHVGDHIAQQIGGQRRDFTGEERLRRGLDLLDLAFAVHHARERARELALRVTLFWSLGVMGADLGDLR